MPGIQRISEIPGVWQYMPTRIVVVVYNTKILWFFYNNQSVYFDRSGIITTLHLIKYIDKYF